MSSCRTVVQHANLGRGLSKATTSFISVRRSLGSQSSTIKAKPFSLSLLWHSFWHNSLTTICLRAKTTFRSTAKTAN